MEHQADMKSQLKEIVDLPEDPTKLEEKAMLFAFEKHSAIDHKRKYSKKPYIIHPAAVADIVREVEHTPEMLAAAWLHDTVEDTNATLQDIREHFGKIVYELVEMLTDVSKPEDGNRRTRKEMDRQHTAKASPEAQTIKLGDLIHNSKSIMANDPDFAVVFMREMRELLEVLTEGNVTLLERAQDIAHTRPTCNRR